VEHGSVEHYIYHIANSAIRT